MRKHFKQVNKQKMWSWLLTGFFIVHVILSHTSFKEYVLCIGSDGHVAFESTVDQATCSDIQPGLSRSDAATHLKYGSLFANSHCGLCLDVPIGSDCHEFSKTQPEKRLPQLHMLALKANVYERYASLETGHTITNNRSNINIDPSLISLQTIVLLI
jgi:hypothetical protein